jgi:hypothetical protein
MTARMDSETVNNGARECDSNKESVMSARGSTMTRRRQDAARPI